EDPDADPVMRISYSRFKSYILCPFQFFAGNVLQLEESPSDSGDEDHEMTALLKGRLAEDVVKGALRYICENKLSKKRAVERAAGDVHDRYASILPPLVLSIYLSLFKNAALLLLDHLEASGYDLASAQMPQRSDIIEYQLLNPAGESPAMILRGIPDLLIWKPGKKNGLMADFKWAGKTTAKPL